YDVCVDGGITSQLPIEIFDVPQENILAFQIVREDQLVYDASQPNTEPSEKIAPYSVMNGLGDYIKATYNLSKEYKQNLKLEDYPKVKLVNISDGNVGPRIRKLKSSTVDLLLENGKTGVEKVF